MTVEKFTVGKSIERFGLWDRLDISVVVKPGENPETVHQEATQLLHKLLNISENQNPIKEEENLPPTKEQGLIQVIQLCSSVKNLEMFRPQVEALGSKEVTEAFENKLKQLP